MSLAQLAIINDELDKRAGIQSKNIERMVIRTNPLAKLHELTELLEERDREIARLKTTYYNLFRYSNIGFAEVSLEGCFLKVNDAWCRLVKRSREELLKLRWQDITKTEYITRDEELVKKLIDSPIQETYTVYKEYWYTDSNGAVQSIPLELTVSCVYDENKKLLNFISQAVDIGRIYREYIQDKKGYCCERHKKKDTNSI